MNPNSYLDGDLVFLGYNDCARKVLSKLHERSADVGRDRPTRVVTTREIVDRPWIEHVDRDYSDRRVLEDLDWSGVGLAVVFRQIEPGDNPPEVDIRTLTTAFRIPEHVRIVAELIDSDYAKILRSDISQPTQVIYNERLDADVVANTVVDPGATSEVLQAIVDPGDHLIRTFELSDFVDADSSTVTVEELRRALLDEDRISLLGVERNGETEPTLNPELHVTVHGDDVLYCLVSNS